MSQLILQSDVKRLIKPEEVDANFAFIKSLADDAGSAAAAAQSAANTANSHATQALSVGQAAKDAADTATATANQALAAAQTASSAAGDKVNNIGNLSGAVDLPYTSGSYVVMTVMGNLSLTLSGVPDSTNAYGMTLEMTNGGSAVVTWPANITWLVGSAPTLRASGKNLITLVTRDGGTTWLGVSN